MSERATELYETIDGMLHYVMGECADAEDKLEAIHIFMRSLIVPSKFSRDILIDLDEYAITDIGE